MSNKYGVDPRKILGNVKLDTTERKKAQAYINKHAKVLRDQALPEGVTPSGRATGVQPTLQKYFYDKGDAVLYAKTGSKQGLSAQIKKPDITIRDFKAPFMGEGTSSDGVIRALIVQDAMITANQQARIINKDDLASNVLMKVADGKAEMAFSKTNKVDMSEDIPTKDIPY